MTRIAIGVTLSAPDRSAPGIAPRLTVVPVPRTRKTSLPDGATCVGYFDEGLPAMVQGVTDAAVPALQQSQEDERQTMRGESPPIVGVANPLGSGPVLSAKSAERLAGQYAVCARFPSGHLLRIGAAYDRPDEAQADLQSCFQPRDGQELVVGICNRWGRRWQEPEFLTGPVRRSAGQETAPNCARTPAMDRSGLDMLAGVTSESSHSGEYPDDPSGSVRSSLAADDQRLGADSDLIV